VVSVCDVAVVNFCEGTFWYHNYLLTSLPLSKRRYCDAQHHAVMLCVCVCVRRISLGDEGNVLYPVLSGCRFVFKIMEVIV